MYKCLDCGKSISPEEIERKVMCPYCGYRILIKERPKIVKKVVL
ncbi:MAG TPA: DNA-directed RNA polymerase subunit P [Nanoarchaeota archaeon]|nr:DNA-directed RNA polymerase subunit P [Nanoarchaeota archaeon]